MLIEIKVFYDTGAEAGAMKIVYFHKGVLSPFLFLCKLGAIMTGDLIGIKRDEFEKTATLI